MSTNKYTLPLESTRWTLDNSSPILFDWEYDEGRDRLLALYSKGKNLQWDGTQRIDWSPELDPDNPLRLPDEAVFIYGSDIWERLDAADRGRVRRHLASWQVSQFLHGEQGALICASRIVDSVPNLDAKLFAATQVMDEARHVEVFSRLLHDKIGMAYPINPSLKTLLGQVLSDSRWDMIYLGMQVLIEGLALAAFSILRDIARDPLVRALNAYVMQDEARHVAFGRLALRDHYPSLTEAERNEREEFVIEACYLMRDRFRAEEVWQNLDIGTAECIAYVGTSPIMREYQSLLFSRIVPIVKDIGLWGPKVQAAFSAMGVINFAGLNPDELVAADEATARGMDDLRRGAAPG